MLLPGVLLSGSMLLRGVKFPGSMPLGSLDSNLFLVSGFDPREEHTPGESIPGRSILLGSRLPKGAYSR